MIIRLKSEYFLDISFFVVITLYLGLISAFTISLVFGAHASIGISLAFAIPISILFGTYLALPFITLYIKRGDEMVVKNLFLFYKAPIYQCKWTCKYITGSSALISNSYRFTTVSLCLEDEKTGKNCPLPSANTKDVIDFFYKNFGINPPTQEVFEKYEIEGRKNKKIQYIITYICLLLNLAIVVLMSYST